MSRLGAACSASAHHARPRAGRGCQHGSAVRSIGAGPRAPSDTEAGRASKTAGNVQQQPRQPARIELSIERFTCTPHRRAHTYVEVSDADQRKLWSSLSRRARCQGGGRSSWLKQERTCQADLL